MHERFLELRSWWHLWSSFLAQMVLSPLNTIWLSIDFAVKNKIYRKKEQDRHVKAQRVIPLWNFDFHARTLAKYGKQPYITESSNRLCQSLSIKLMVFEVSHTKWSRVCYWIYSCFFLTLPELFVQWSKFKDSEKRTPQDSVINFEGLECFWPTFSTATKRKRSRTSRWRMYVLKRKVSKAILFHLISTRFSRIAWW
jgi:hypothetical protein